MTDRDRLLAFLDGARLRYRTDDEPGFVILPMDPAEINYVTHSSAIETPQGLYRFAEDGHLVSISHSAWKGWSGTGGKAETSE